MRPPALAAALALTLAAVAGAFMPPEVASGGSIDPGDTAWMLTASALVLLMTPGLSFFYGGMVRRKNVLSTMLQSYVAMGVVSLLWVTVGFSLAFGDSIGGVVGDPRTFLFLNGVGSGSSEALSPTIPLALFALFQLKFAIITPALVTGSFAERVRFSAYILFIVLFSVFVYAPLAHMTWHPDGLLRQAGVLDFAGGTVVHMSAGLAALAGAWWLGPRDAHQPGHTHEPAHIPYVLLGTGMLWFGWFGFNAGSSLGANGTAVQAFLTTNTASAAAMVAWLVLESLRGGKPSAMGACIGAVVGLVAITPAAGFVTLGASLFIGAFASGVSFFLVHLKNRTRLDDTLDVFPCHGAGGMVGMLLTGVFSSKTINPAGADGLLYGGTDLFVRHTIALGAVTVAVFAASAAIYAIVDRILPLRVGLEAERVGLDRSQHGERVFGPDDDALAAK
ncbi:MAG: ammonium transporter [Pseudomonadota bacterium]|jgi:Amt family ammonium transporter